MLWPERAGFFFIFIVVVIFLYQFQYSVVQRFTNQTDQKSSQILLTCTCEPAGVGVCGGFLEEHGRTSVDSISTSYYDI